MEKILGNQKRKVINLRFPQGSPKSALQPLCRSPPPIRQSPIFSITTSNSPKGSVKLPPLKVSDTSTQASVKIALLNTVKLRSASSIDIKKPLSLELRNSHINEEGFQQPTPKASKKQVKKVRSNPDFSNLEKKEGHRLTYLVDLHNRVEGSPLSIIKAVQERLANQNK